MQNIKHNKGLAPTPIIEVKNTMYCENKDNIKKCVMTHNKFKLVRGFTLVEMLIAVAILVMILAAAVNVEVSNTRLADFNKHRLQAAGLTQEQLNLIKTIRDNSIISTDPEKDPFEGLGVNDNKKIEKDGANKWKIGDLSPDEISKGGKEIEIDGTKYYVKINIKPADDTGAPGALP